MEVIVDLLADSDIQYYTMGAPTLNSYVSYHVSNLVMAALEYTHYSIFNENYDLSTAK